MPFPKVLKRTRRDSAWGQTIYRQPKRVSSCSCKPPISIFLTVNHLLPPILKKSPVLLTGTQPEEYLPAGQSGYSKNFCWIVRIAGIALFNIWPIFVRSQSARSTLETGPVGEAGTEGVRSTRTRDVSGSGPIKDGHP